MAESDFEVVRVVGEVEVSPDRLLVGALVSVRGTPCFSLRTCARNRGRLRPLRNGLTLGVEKIAAAHALTGALLRAILAGAGGAAKSGQAAQGVKAESEVKP